MALSAVLIPIHAQAQTTFRSSFFLGAINYEDRNAPTAIAHGFFQQGGALLSSTGQTSYSFGEGTGTALGADSDTITLSGHGDAAAVGFGFSGLKARVEATLENASLYEPNIENAPDIGGMKAPYVWLATATAGWDLKTTFVSTSLGGIGYTVKWIFGVDGSVNDVDAGYGSAYLSFRRGAYASSFQTTSLTPQLWATPSLPLEWGTEQTTSATFAAQWQYNLIGDATQVPDGYLAPPQLNGTVDYYSSATFQEAQVFDAEGNRVYDFHIEDGSGNVLYAGAAAAPEPGTFVLVGAGVLVGLGVLRRRRA
jgi:hypothetical protein